MKTRIHARADASAGMPTLFVTHAGATRQRFEWRYARRFVPYLLGALAAAVLSGSMLTEPPVAASGARGRISVQSAGRGLPHFNLRDGYALNLDYRGDQAALAALQTGTARALSLAS